MSEKHYIACDLGAESGRVILGRLADGKLQLEEVHRFANQVVRIQDSMRWNLLGIYEELKQGLRKVADRNIPVASLSVDSWGVDYVLLNKQQPMLSLPYHYRDSRSELPYEQALQQVGRELIFDKTGIQFMAINTLYQLMAEMKENPEVVGVADHFLNIADYFNYLFSGVGCVEVSMASTTQLYNPKSQEWSAKLIQQFNMPEKLFPPIVESGSKLGPLQQELVRRRGSQILMWWLLVPTIRERRLLPCPLKERDGPT